jgi:hypothetical protein
LVVGRDGVRERIDERTSEGVALRLLGRETVAVVLEDVRLSRKRDGETRHWDVDSLVVRHSDVVGPDGGVDVQKVNVGGARFDLWETEHLFTLSSKYLYEKLSRLFEYFLALNFLVYLILTI